MTTMWCPRCDKRKTPDGFHNSSRNSSGRQSFCKDCQCAARRKTYRTNPEREAAYSKAYRARHRAREAERPRKYRASNYLAEILRAGKNRARRAGLPADGIEVADLLADWERRGITPEACAYCGGEFKELEHMHPLSREGSPGHVMTNLAPSCAGCNRTKRARHWVEFLADRMVPGNTE